MLDEKDINKLKSVFATKGDFKNLATKKDLGGLKTEIKKDFKSFTTKKDLGELRIEIKKDLENFATKKDLEKAISDSQNKMLSLLVTKKEFNELKKEVEYNRELLQGLIVSVDSLVKSISDLTAEYKAVSVQLTRHERWIKEIAEKVGLKLAIE